MTIPTALAFLERIENDDELAAALGAIKDDPEAVLARVRAEGFDVTPDDIRAAVAERYGEQLTTEQLETIAAGANADGAVVVGVVWGLVAVGAAAAAA